MKKYAAALVVVAVCAVASQAAVVFNDDFSSGVLNTAVWTNTSQGAGTATVSGGKLTVQAAGGWYGNMGAIKSNASATLAAGQTVTLSACDSPIPTEPSYGMQWNAYPQSSSWGLTDGAGNSIYVHTDEYTQNLKMVIQTNGVTQTLADIQDPRWMLYGWTIAWSADKVVVTSNVWGVRFDSSNPAKNGGLTWNIPSVGTSMYAFAEADVSTNYLAFDEMKLTTPEPVSICLFGLAGLLLRRRAA